MKSDLRMSIENIFGMAFITAYLVMGVYYVIIQSLAGMLVIMMFVGVLFIDIRTMKRNVRIVRERERVKT